VSDLEKVREALRLLVVEIETHLGPDQVRALGPLSRAWFAANDALADTIPNEAG
jgi:hypothetical protein